MEKLVVLMKQKKGFDDLKDKFFFVYFQIEVWFSNIYGNGFGKILEKDIKDFMVVKEFKVDLIG